MLLDDQRSGILASIDGSVGVDGREDDGEAGTLLREIRRQRKQLVGAEQRAAQSGDDVSLEVGAWNWEELVEQSSDYLTRFGKDLEPIAVLIEASVRSDGSEDLAAAMLLLAEVVETYWETGLYPAEDDEDGVAARFQPLSGLSGGGAEKEGALIPPLRRMVLLQAGGRSLRYIDKISADVAMRVAQSLSEDQKAARIEKAGETYQEIERCARSASQPQIQQVIEGIKTAEKGWRQAIGFISDRTKPLYPSASMLSEELSNIEQWLQSLMTYAIPGLAIPAVAESVAVSEAQSGDVSVPTASSVPFTIGRITRREDALQAIMAVAEYFSVYEPLSPLGATLREVDRRARMSLNTLLAELIPDDSAREQFYWRAGIKPPSDAESN